MGIPLNAERIVHTAYEVLSRTRKCPGIAKRHDLEEGRALRSCMDLAHCRLQRSAAGIREMVLL